MSNYAMHPKTENSFRRASQWKSCAGVMSPSFVCKKCDQERRIAGRKQVVKGTNKFGYVCAECAGSVGQG